MAIANSVTGVWLSLSYSDGDTFGNIHKSQTESSDSRPRTFLICNPSSLTFSWLVILQGEHHESASSAVHPAWWAALVQKNED